MKIEKRERLWTGKVKKQSMDITRSGLERKRQMENIEKTNKSEAFELNLASMQLQSAEDSKEYTSLIITEMEVG